MTLFFIKLVCAVGFSFLMTYVWIKLQAWWGILTQILVAVCSAVYLAIILLIWIAGPARSINPDWSPTLIWLAVTGPGFLLTKWIDD
jgi:hypothetical protein